MKSRPDDPAPTAATPSRPLRNPFEGTRGHDCFGCSPRNPHGLRLRFSEEGDRIVCRWTPDARFQSWDGVLHGGIVAAILDETAGWTVLRRFRRAAMTTRLDIRFLHPAHVTDPFLLAAAWYTGRVNDHVVTLHATLSDAAGTLCAEADADYYVMDAARSRAMGFSVSESESP